MADTEISTADKTRKVAQLAQLQHLVVATWQLTLLGLSDTAIRTRVEQEGWRRWSRGIYLLPGPITAKRRLAAALLAYSRPRDAADRVAAYQAEQEGTPLVEALAHVAFRAGVVVCGPSAAWLHGLEKAPAASWLRVPTHSGRAPRKLVSLCHGTYTGPVCWIDGLPVVDVAQAVLDVAAMAHDSARHRHHRLTRLLATADAKRLATVDAVESRLTDVGNVRGRQAVGEACQDLRGELSHSGTEAEARRVVGRVLARFGLVLEPRPHPIELGGVIVGEADLAVLVLRLDLEIDGPHHLLASQRDKDHIRDRLVRRADWAVERFSAEMVDLQPAVFEAQVVAIVEHRLAGVTS